jgi:hypothetical protein
VIKGLTVSKLFLTCHSPAGLCPHSSRRRRGNKQKINIINLLIVTDNL